MSSPSVDWFVAALRARREVVAAEVAEHFTPTFVEDVSADGIAGGMSSMAIGLQVVDPITIEDDGTVRVPLGGTTTFAQYRVRLGIDGDRLSFFDFGPMEIEGIDIEVKSTSELTDADRAGLHRVFDDAYIDGDHGYVDEQLAMLKSIALAGSVEEGVVGFALSDARVLDLPRLPGQVLRTAGLSCVLSNHKRKGISSRSSRWPWRSEMPRRRCTCCSPAASHTRQGCTTFDAASRSSRVPTTALPRGSARSRRPWRPCSG
ncbi:MAG TPA: hypothetical protein VM143_02235 [Acidimicrobiales bacterium]|nr:hypothetical protein [Acidimicrobiales bacterium]